MVRPPARQLASYLEHDLGERSHPAALLDDGQERAGVEQPAGGVLPAHERFGPDNRTALDVDLRLVVQHELVFNECGVEVLEHFEAAAVGLVELRVADLDARPMDLGREHRDIGATQQVPDADARGLALGDAGARGDAHPSAVDDERSGEAVEDPFGNLAPVVPGSERDEQRKLITA
jgi:hypothetical protein